MLYGNCSIQIARIRLILITSLSPKGSALGRALRQTGRDDILKQSMQNIELVHNEREFSRAMQSLQQEEGDECESIMIFDVLGSNQIEPYFHH